MVRLAPWFLGRSHDRARRRLRRRPLADGALDGLDRDRRRRDALRRTRLPRLGVALRRALRADRDHRARGVDRGDRARRASISSGTRCSRSRSAVSFAGAAAAWWAYFDFTQLAVERALHAAREETRGHLARDVYTFFHYPIVLGIVFLAVASKKTLAAPGEPLSDGGRAALALGISLFLLGFVLIRYRVIRRIAWERIGAALAVVAAVLVLEDADALAAPRAGVVALVAALAVESIRLRERSHSRWSSRASPRRRGPSTAGAGCVHSPGEPSGHVRGRAPARARPRARRHRAGAAPRLRVRRADGASRRARARRPPGLDRGGAGGRARVSPRARAVRRARSRAPGSRAARRRSPAAS